MTKQEPSRISRRVLDLKPSGIRRFFDMANELKGQVISLSIGEPDFVTPWHISEEGIYSLERGRTHYTANQGMMELREEIAAFTKRRYGYNYAAKNEVLVTVGGSEAIDAAVRSLINPGDEVLIPEPAYVAYAACVSLSGGVPVALPLAADRQFKLQAEDLIAGITERTKLILLAYPNHPTGAVISEADWAHLVPVLLDHPRIMIISDELYAELTYKPADFYSLANFSELRDRCVVIGGFSKAFAMTGWRIGYALGPADVIAAMNKIHQYVIMSAPTMAQSAAIEALRNGDDAVEEMRQAYNQRRRVLVKRLNAMGLACFEPLGAFYVFPDIRSTGMDSTTFCEELLKQQKVAIIPGSAFGESGEGFVRISYAASLENIESALDRIEQFIGYSSAKDKITLTQIEE